MTSVFAGRAGRGTMAACALLGLAVAAGPSAARAKWPERPVTLIVIAGAGGGSDFTMRVLARELEDKLGQPFRVVNQPQGSGVVGMTTYTSAAPDGYTLGQLSPFAQYKLLGQASFTSASYSPIAQFNADPAAVHVAAGSKFKSVGEIVDALKKDPGSLRISCGGSCNASWDIPFIAMLLDQGIDARKLTLIPAGGSAAGLQELASGGVDVVLCSLPEVDALRDAGRVRSVAVMSETRVEGYPDVPTVGEQIGRPVSGGTWRALAGPPGMDPALVREIEAAVKDAFQKERFQREMKARRFGAVWLGQDELKAFMTRHEEETARVVNAVGYAK